MANANQAQKKQRSETGAYITQTKTQTTQTIVQTKSPLNEARILNHKGHKGHEEETLGGRRCIKEPFLYVLRVLRG
jgi:hypothetical protein